MHHRLTNPYALLLQLLMLLEGTRYLMIDGSSVPSQPLSTKADPVKVDFYMEALCPYCTLFTTHTLAQMQTDGLFDIMELMMVPFGNAKRVNSTFACQHGPAECEGNRIELCVIDSNPGQERWFPFVSCFESYFPATHDARLTATSCAKKYDVDIDATLECAYGKQGTDLEELAYARTGSLSPPHTFVPWVVVNGVPACTIDGGCTDVPRIICDTYSGEKPEVCTTYSKQPKGIRKLALGLTAKQSEQQQVCMKSSMVEITK